MVHRGGGGVHDVMGDSYRAFVVRVAHRLAPLAKKLLRLYFK